MSETPLDDETPLDGLTPIQAALVQFTGCIGASLDDICSYGLTIGEAYVPFDPDPEDECEDEEAMCSQAWVRVADVSITDVTPSFEMASCTGTQVLTLEVGIIRCFGIPEDGEAPTASEVLAASLQAMEDMNKIYCAAMACEVWEELNVGQWVPLGPLGGQYGGVWTFTATVV